MLYDINNSISEKKGYLTESDMVISNLKRNLHWFRVNFYQDTFDRNILCRYWCTEFQQDALQKVYKFIIPVFNVNIYIHWIRLAEQDTKLPFCNCN